MEINTFIIENVIPEIECYPFFKEAENIIDAIVNIRRIIRSLRINHTQCSNNAAPKIHKSAIVQNSYIGSNVIIHEGCSIRDSIILDNTTVGHGSEIARSIILQSCEIPGFNYIGSSLLGERVWLGGHVSIASRRHDNKNITLRFGNYSYATKHWKFGGIIGSDVRIGYCSHVNPGCIIGLGSFIGTHVDLKIYVSPHSIVTSQQKLKVSRMRQIPSVNKEDK